MLVISDVPGTWMTEGQINKNHRILSTYKHGKEFFSNSKKTCIHEYFPIEDTRVMTEDEIKKYEEKQLKKKIYAKKAYLNKKRKLKFQKAEDSYRRYQKRKLALESKKVSSRRAYSNR